MERPARAASWESLAVAANDVVPRAPESGFFVKERHPREGDLTVSTVTTDAGLARLRADYDALAATQPVRVPFSLHEWHAAWWAHFAKRSAAVRDELCIKVFRRGDRTVGIVPWVRTVTPALGPVRMCSLRLLGADPGITEIKTVLVDRSEEHAVGELLGQELRRDLTWDFIQWSGLDPTSAFFRALSQVHPIEYRPREPDYVLDLPSSWEELRRGLKRNIKESLRHGYNSLAKDGHAFRFDVIASRDAMGRALGAFHRLHTQRANLGGTVAHPDRFSTVAARSFLSDVMDRLAERGIARAFTMSIGGEVVAIRLGFSLGDALYLYYSGFDPAWRKYGVMTTTLAETIRHAIGTGMRTVNLSPGTDISKTRWSPRTVTFDEGVQIRPTLRSRLAYEGYVKAREMRGRTSMLR